MEQDRFADDDDRSFVDLTDNPTGRGVTADDATWRGVTAADATGRGVTADDATWRGCTGHDGAATPGEPELTSY